MESKYEKNKNMYKEKRNPLYSFNLNEAREIFRNLSLAIKNRASFSINSKELESVDVSWNKYGNGLRHIIKRRFGERYRDGKDSNIASHVRDICAILIKSIDNVVSGDSIEGKNHNTWEFHRDGITAIVKRDHGKYLLSCYGDYDKNIGIKKEATETISAVNAQYGYTPEFLDLYAQVGAVIASDYNVPVPILEVNN